MNKKYYVRKRYISNGAPTSYGRNMDMMDKLYDGHLWCTTKTINI